MVHFIMFALIFICFSISVLYYVSHFQPSTLFSHVYYKQQGAITMKQAKNHVGWLPKLLTLILYTYIYVVPF